MTNPLKHLSPSLAISVAALALAATGVGAATPYLTSGSSIRPGSIPERALVPALRDKIDHPTVSGEILGLTEVEQPETLPTQTGTAITSYWATCPSGTTLISGGAGADSTASDQAVQILSSAPDQANNSWSVDVRNYTGFTVTVWVTAYCARLS